jgi:hypothetical protein
MSEELERVFGVSKDDLETDEQPIIFTNFLYDKKQYSLISDIKEGESWES